MLTFAAFCILGLFLASLQRVDTTEAVDQAMSYIRPGIPYAEFLEKEKSLTARWSLLESGMSDVLSGSYLGLPYDLTETGGVFFHSLFYGGLIAIPLTLAVFYDLFRQLARLAVEKGYWIFASLMLGTYLQALIFTSGSVVTLAGFLLNALVIIRLRELARDPMRPRGRGNHLLPHRFQSRLHVLAQSEASRD